jgi:N-acetylmuramoyl-L-alanine amidase
MLQRARRLLAALVSSALLLASCGPATPSPSRLVSAQPSASAIPSAGGVGQVVPAPGSSSSVYKPNPGAIVVAIDPGHGGCLDWGVPDPLRRGPAFSEKTMTLAIGLELKRLLEAQGITVVMTRRTDEALAGDVDPAHGCAGAPFRDVNGDGKAGFDPQGAIRTHDELQARLDLVNLARADVLVSIHINSVTQNGVVVEIGLTETYYTDETPWGVGVTKHLAQHVQDGVVAALNPVAAYKRQDRGISAVNFFIVAPPLFMTTPDRPDPLKQPRRGALMPAILTEVGSITLAAEHDLLQSPAGQAAAAQGIAKGLEAHFGDRPLAVRYDASVAGGEAGVAPVTVLGTGPPFWAPVLPPEAMTAGIAVRLTNTGTVAWPADLRLLGGWTASDEPYLRVAPTALASLGVAIPGLAPGESVELHLLPVAPAGGARQVLWISLANSQGSLADLGSPPLQLASKSP